MGRIKNIVGMFGSIALVGSMVGVAAYFSEPGYREFVPTDGVWGYHLFENEGKISVHAKNSLFYFANVVDEDGDLKADYTMNGMAAGIRFAGVIKRKPTLEEIEIFDKVISKSKRFGRSEKK